MENILSKDIITWRSEYNINNFTSQMKKNIWKRVPILNYMNINNYIKI